MHRNYTDKQDNVMSLRKVELHYIHDLYSYGAEKHAKYERRTVSPGDIIIRCNSASEALNVEIHQREALEVRLLPHVSSVGMIRDFVIPLKYTSKYADAFDAFEYVFSKNESTRILLQHHLYVALEVSAKDKGLRELFGETGIDENWHSLIVTMFTPIEPLCCEIGYASSKDGVLYTDPICFSAPSPPAGSVRLNAWHAAGSFEAKRHRSEALKRAVAAADREHSMIVIRGCIGQERDDYLRIVTDHDILFLALLPYWKGRTWWSEVDPTLRMQQCFVSLVGPTESLDAQLAVIEKTPRFGNPYASHSDWQFTKITADNTKQKLTLRGRVLREKFYNQLMTFCMVFRDLLTPYVALWIFDWLPGSHLYSHLQKVRYTEQMLCSVRAVKQRGRAEIKT